MNETKNFKSCPSCLHAWETREDFLADGNLLLNGYQADFQDLEHGMFFFTHKVADCASTMALMVEDFRNLYTGPTYPTSKALSEECPRYCIDENEMSRCEALCECAFVREIIQIIRNRQVSAECPV